MARIRAKNTPTFRIGNIPSNEQPITGHGILEVFSTFRTIDDSTQEHNGAYVCNGAVFRRNQFVGKDNPYDLLVAKKAESVSLTTYDEILKEYGFCDKFGLDETSEQFRIPYLPSVVQTVSNPFTRKDGITDDEFDKPQREITLTMVFMVQLSAQYEEMSLANISETINELAVTATNTIESTRDNIIYDLSLTGKTYLDTISFYQETLNDNSETVLSKFNETTKTYQERLNAVLGNLQHTYAYDSLVTRPLIVKINPVDYPKPEEGVDSPSDTSVVQKFSSTYVPTKSPENTTTLFYKDFIRMEDGELYPVMDGVVDYGGEKYPVENETVTIGQNVYPVYHIDEDDKTLADIFNKTYDVEEVLEYEYSKDENNNYSVTLYPIHNRIYFIQAPIHTLRIKNVPQSYLETLIYYTTAPTGINLSIDENTEIINPENIDRNLGNTKYVMSILNGRVAVGIRELQHTTDVKHYVFKDEETNENCVNVDGKAYPVVDGVVTIGETKFDVFTEFEDGEYIETDAGKYYVSTDTSDGSKYVTIDDNTYPVSNGVVTIEETDYTVSSEVIEKEYILVPKKSVDEKDDEYKTDKDNLWLLSQASKNEFSQLQSTKEYVISEVTRISKDVDTLKTIVEKNPDNPTYSDSDNSLQFDRDENIDAWKDFSTVTQTDETNETNVFESGYDSLYTDALKDNLVKELKNWYNFNYSHRNYVSDYRNEPDWLSSTTTSEKEVADEMELITSTEGFKEPSFTDNFKK